MAPLLGMPTLPVPPDFIFLDTVSGFGATLDRSRKCENRAAGHYGRRLHPRD